LLAKGLVLILLLQVEFSIRDLDVCFDRLILFAAVGLALALDLIVRPGHVR